MIDENNTSVLHVILTNENMTRFLMTLEDSVELIDYAINNGISGDTIISELKSINIKDLIELFSEKYKNGLPSSILIYLKS